MKNAAKFVDNPDLKAMLRETTGIGTEATRADIIKNLLKKHFLTKKNREIQSTDAGRAVITTVTPQISDPAITALWEQSLDDIAHGKQTKDAFLERQEQWIKQLVSHAINESSTTGAFQQLAKHSPCPKCGKPLKRKKGKHGFFLSCSGYPKCQYTAPDIDSKGAKKILHHSS
jgi:DNA topoisomerase-3